MKRNTNGWCLFVTAMLLSIGAPGSLSAQRAVPGYSEIREILAERVDSQRRNVGIVVGIATPEDRQIVAYGRVSLDSTEPVTGDTVFEIGSVTKAFTSMLLADMMQEGEARLDDPIADYLPADATIRSRGGRTITVADLATHTSGLPLWPSDVPATREGALSMAAYTEPQLLEYLATFEIRADIGQTWSYSNVDAGLLGLGLAHRAGTTYERLLEQRITGPLGMQSTGVMLGPDAIARHAVGYDAEMMPAPAWNVPALPGAGSLHSTVDDLLTLLTALVQDRQPLAGLLPIMLETRRPGPGIPQTLGWLIVSTGPGDEGILTHDGETLGFASSIAYDPATRTGVAVLSNTANGVGDIARHLLRPAIPLTQPVAPGPERSEIEVDPAVFDRYAGRYEPAPGIAFEVTRTDDALMIQLPGVPQLRLHPESEREFFIAEDTNVTITFDVAPDGSVTGLLLRSSAGDASAMRVAAP